MSPFNEPAEVIHAVLEAWRTGQRHTFEQLLGQVAHTPETVRTHAHVTFRLSLRETQTVTIGSVKRALSFAAVELDGWVRFAPAIGACIFAAALGNPAALRDISPNVSAPLELAFSAVLLNDANPERVKHIIGQANFLAHSIG